MLKLCDSILRRRVVRSLFDSNEILFSFSNLLLPGASNEVIDSFFYCVLMEKKIRDQRVTSSVPGSIAANH